MRKHGKRSSDLLEVLEGLLHEGGVDVTHPEGIVWVIVPRSQNKRLGLRSELSGGLALDETLITFLSAMNVRRIRVLVTVVVSRAVSVGLR